ncbi:hypothetical protein Tco_1164023 [Tanacetum coccineum]
MKEYSKHIDWGQVKITTDIMEGYVMPKYGKTNWMEDDSWTDIILDDVSVFVALLEKLEVDLARAIKAKEAKEAELKAKEAILTEVVQVSSDDDDSSDEGLFGNEDVVLFNDVKYPLTDAEIRMFKERPTTSRAPLLSLPQDLELSLLPLLMHKLLPLQLQEGTGR